MMKTSKSFIVIITAAGSSVRMGGKKKEFLPLGTGSVLSSSVKTFLNFNNPNFKLQKLIITIPKENYSIQDFKEKLNDIPAELVDNILFVKGGDSRQISVFNALDSVKELNIDYVLIHDGARPFVTTEVINEVVEGVIKNNAVTPGIPPVDTIKQINKKNIIIKHLERKSLVCVQTPQAFDFKKLYKAHIKANKDKKEYTDDTEIYAKYSGKVSIVQGDVKNIKITYPGDLEKCIR